eukprot:1772411-Rhodomonas_salina.2
MLVLQSYAGTELCWSAIAGLVLTVSVWRYQKQAARALINSIIDEDLRSRAPTAPSRNQSRSNAFCTANAVFAFDFAPVREAWC